MKLEKGKWYKWFQTNHNNTHIGKFDSISTENVVRMKPWIIQATSYNVSGAFERQFMQDIVEITDLTEIQKLLPDVIAKPKFIVGKWYKNLNYGKNWIAKAISDSRMSGDNFYHGDYITDSKVFCEQSVSISNLRWNEDTVECPLSEIQQYLPEGHVDKVKSAIIGAETTKGVLLPKSERYTATMKFFEQLREPERSEAIENYNEGCSETLPVNLHGALSSGFAWDESKQGGKYWNNLHNSIIDNTYFKEPETETLVFGKYKVGDVVVSLTAHGSSREEGSLFIVKEDSVPHKLCYDTCFGSSLPNDWRLATPEEVEAYNSGIKNIADIKPKDYNEAVHCTTQEEWDFVLSKFNPRSVRRESYLVYGNRSTITTQHTGNSYIGCYSNVEYDKKELCTILTFKQWCDKYNHCYVKEPISLEGRYIKCLKENGWNNGKTKVGQVLKIDIVNRNGDFWIEDECLDKKRIIRGEFELLPIDYSPDLIKEETIPDKPSEVDISYRIDKIGNFYIDDICVSNCTSITPKEVYPNYSMPKPTTIILKTKSKSIKL